MTVRRNPIPILFAGLLVCLSGCASLPWNDSPEDEGADMVRELRELREARSQADAASPPEPDTGTVASHMEAGDRHRRAGEDARALWSYLRAHSLDRDDPQPLQRIAGMHLEGDPMRAEAIFRELVHRDPDSLLARTGLGIALIARGKWQLQQTVNGNGGLPISHDALGVTLEHLGRADEAQAQFRRAAELQPMSHVPWNNLAVSLLAAGKPEESVAVLQRAVQLEERDPSVWNNLGLALGKLGQYEDALTAFRRAGSERAAFNNLGLVQEMNGDCRTALRTYERALHAEGPPEERRAVMRNARSCKPSPSAIADSSPDVPGSATAPVEREAFPAAPDRRDLP
jgi:Flp pilus assembly protein TadD